MSSSFGVPTDFPPDSGSIEFSVDASPVSLQADAKRRQLIRDAIQPAVRSNEYLLSGDVQIEIDWLIHERERYEADSSPDVDNVIKPMLDSLCGPEGLLIDDCQVQALDCRWIDWTRDNQRVTFHIRFFPDEWVLKDRLVLVHAGRNLYLPLNLGFSKEVVLTILDIVESGYKTRDELQKLTGDYYASRRVLPVQRHFHKSRVTKFHLIEATELRATLEKPT